MLRRDGVPVGRVGFAVAGTCPPEFLGDLPPTELHLDELELPWDGDRAAAGRRTGRSSAGSARAPWTATTPGTGGWPTATIASIGVLPDHRGRGYVDDLVLAGTAAARAAGHTAVLSDVDTVDLTMARAMRRAGHRDDVRPGHVWHHRGRPST